MADTDLRGLATKFGAVATALSGAGLRKVTTTVAVDAKKDVDFEVGRDLGPDRRMSGWGRFRFGSGFDLTSDSTAELSPRPAGPWAVLERGRRAKSAGQPKRKRSKVYRTPHGLRTATKASPFRQGATRGHKTWTIAVKRIERETPQRVAREVNKALVEAFG